MEVAVDDDITRPKAAVAHHFQPLVVYAVLSKKSFEGFRQSVVAQWLYEHFVGGLCYNFLMLTDEGLSY